MVALGIVAVMSVLVANRDSIFNSSLEVMKSTPETIIQVEKVDTLEDRIKNAQEAVLPQLEASAQEAYDAYLQKELKRVEDKVKTEYIGEIEATITDQAY